MLSFIYNYLIINSFLLLLTYNLNKNFFKIEKEIFTLNLAYHLSITIIYVYLFNDQAADYKTYLALTNYEGFHIHSLFSSQLITLIVAILKLKFLLNDLNIILIFSLFSFFGIVIFIKNLQKLGIEKKITYLLLFLPGIHFWTSVPGKDSIILFLLSFFFYLYLDRKILISLFFLFFVFLVRPHIGIIFILTIAITEFIFIQQYKKKIFIFLFTTLTLTLIFSTEGVQSFLMSEIPDTSNMLILMIHKLHDFSGKYQSSSTYYENLNIVFNIFNYLLFPIQSFIKNNSLLVNFSILVELLTLIFFIFLVKKQKKSFKFDKKNFTFLTICCSIYLMLLPQIFFNYGLNVRQKWMIIPFLIYLIFLSKDLFVKLKRK